MCFEYTHLTHGQWEWHLYVFPGLSQSFDIVYHRGLCGKLTALWVLSWYLAGFAVSNLTSPSRNTLMTWSLKKQQSLLVSFMFHRWHNNCRKMCGYGLNPKEPCASGCMDDNKWYASESDKESSRVFWTKPVFLSSRWPSTHWTSELLWTVHSTHRPRTTQLYVNLEGCRYFSVTRSEDSHHKSISTCAQQCMSSTRMLGTDVDGPALNCTFDGSRDIAKLREVQEGATMCKPRMKWSIPETTFSLDFSTDRRLQIERCSWLW